MPRRHSTVSFATLSPSPSRSDLILASLSATIAAAGGNANFDADASYAKAIPAFLLLGASHSTWGSIPLPFDMAAIHPPGVSSSTTRSSS